MYVCICNVVCIISPTDLECVSVAIATYVTRIIDLLYVSVLWLFALCVYMYLFVYIGFVLSVLRYLLAVVGLGLIYMLHRIKLIELKRYDQTRTSFLVPSNATGKSVSSTVDTTVCYS